MFKRSKTAFTHAEMEKKGTVGNECYYRLHTYNSEKCKNYGICFTDKTILFRRDFQTLKERAARAGPSSNVHQFCIPKSSCFMRETAKRISFFLEILMLYGVY